MYKRILLVSILLLIIGSVFALPVTTFESFQVSGTTDQNITLTCTDNNSGCKAINYNIDNNGWINTTNLNLDSNIFNIAFSSYGKGVTTTIFTADKNYQYVKTISGKIKQAPGSGPEHPVYVKFTTYFKDGTNIESPSYGGLYTTNFNYTPDRNILKYINYITSYTWGDGFYTQDLNGTLTVGYNSPEFYSFLYSGSGDHNIQYFSTDNADNNETTNTSYFPMIRTTADQENSRLRLLSVPLYNNETITSWQWIINGSNLSGTTDQNRYYYTNANLDLNICVILNDTYSNCQNETTWDTKNPTIDANIDSSTYGFTSTFDVNYQMTCYDNFSPINYLIQFLDNNGTTVTLSDSDHANATLQSDTYSMGFAQGTFRFTCTDDYNNTAIYNSPEIYALQFNLVNEETGEPFTTSELDDMNKAQVESIDGNFIYDFQGESEITTNFFSPVQTLIFAFQYNDGSLTEVDKEFNFSLVTDSNIPICVANYQQFYEQRFTSLSNSKQISLYNTQAKCYSLAGLTHYAYDTGYMINVFTINKPYVLNTITNGVSSQLALINGAVASEHNLDAIIFRQTDFDIQVSIDTLAFSPLYNETTGKYDLNVMQIYYKTLDQNNESIIITIQNQGRTTTYSTSTITEDPNEFLFNWYYGDLNNVTDQNLFYASIEVTRLDGTTETFGQYFNIKGEAYSVAGFEGIAFILAIGFILFGLTLVSAGDALGWFGVLICFIGLAISSFAIPVWWISMLQATIVMIIIFVFFTTGRTRRGIA